MFRGDLLQPEMEMVVVRRRLGLAEELLEPLDVRPREGVGRLEPPRIVPPLRLRVLDDEDVVVESRARWEAVYRAEAPRLWRSLLLVTGDPELASDDLLTDVSTCRRIVEDKGMEMLVLDQTRPDIGLPVAKVIVPGLRHFWARFAPGRLYDVPVQIGWRDEPLREDELNPIPFLL